MADPISEPAEELRHFVISNGFSPELLADIAREFGVSVQARDRACSWPDPDHSISGNRKRDLTVRNSLPQPFCGSKAESCNTNKPLIG
jgi:hypothetical protein